MNVFLNSPAFGAVVGLAGVVIGAVLGAWLSKGVRKKQLTRDKVEMLHRDLMFLVAYGFSPYHFTAENVTSFLQQHGQRMVQSLDAANEVILTYDLYRRLFPHGRTNLASFMQFHIQFWKTVSDLHLNLLSVTSTTNEGQRIVKLSQINKAYHTALQHYPAYSKRATLLMKELEGKGGDLA